ncbi:MAG: cysteine--tRNA ligase, partial [Cyanobacteria bacterium K_Offshore_0m_m2_072]|nr:cysteine--tRNA ligase [Cyanobacteria bacterium K_Offshore_0m_m2_072]
YGKLSGRDLAEQQQGASGRTATAEEARKQHPFDFALWKGAKPGEPSFDSPWGPGRPGWHIECSAMAREELGTTIDIHLGGADLIFPHHENEIAQSEAASGQPLARTWLHNGMVNVGGEKMSKSLGNFTTIRALLDSGVSPMTLRLFVLQAHYRKPLDFTAEALEAAATGWQGLNAALGLVAATAGANGINPDTDAPSTSTAITAQAQAALPAELNSARERFIAAMDDDLNTSAALAVLFELAKPLRALANRLERGDGAAEVEAQAPANQQRGALLHELAGVVGLKAESTGAATLSGSSAADGGSTGPSDAEINALIEQRRAAKAAKDFATADAIRAQLLEAGIELIDKPGGFTDWLRR